jgi:hypothetical protein
MTIDSAALTCRLLRHAIISTSLYPYRQYPLWQRYCRTAVIGDCNAIANQSESQLGKLA